MTSDHNGRLARRANIARASRRQAGLLTTSQLRVLGVSDGALRAEITGQRWQKTGRSTVRVEPPAASDTVLWWHAVLACSPLARARGACTAALGGLTALVAGGLTGIDGGGLVHLVVPKSSRPLPAQVGVRVHETRRWRDEDIVGTPIPRVRVPMAAVQAALWARTDREATLLLVAPVQQRLTTAAGIGEALEIVRRDRRRALMRAIVRELVDGVASLNELDFAVLCRRRGLPEPSRQVVVRTATGRAYLDVRWDRYRVTVEVDGVGHLRVDRWLDDSLRHNEIAVTGDVVLRVPSLGLRLEPDRHLDLVDRALRSRGWRPL